jgi:pimeloyl-ACP methyl ester carboxylesterase
MKTRNLVLFGIGLVCVSLSLWQIFSAQKGLEVVDLHTTDPPTTVIAPSGSSPTGRPTVLVAHGFAGSAVLMRGFAFTLAHAGYTTVSWDFKGHGANPNPLVLSGDSSSLLNDAESALAYAVSAGLADPQRVAILGHSMGSGVALEYGVAYPDTNATVAISPVPKPVTPQLPHNLLLMAGSLEPQFAYNARQILSMAGGVNGDFAAGIARDLTIIPGVEHISILFSHTTHTVALSWLNSTYGPQPGASPYTDTRIFWYILGILGFIFIANASVNSLPSSARENKIPSLPVRLLALPVGTIAATGILWLLGQLRVNLSQILGVSVGGYLVIWFLIAGVVSLLIIRPHFYLPRVVEIAKSLLVFAGLWLGVGLIGNIVWIPWLLIPQRLLIWVPGTIFLLAWFYSIAEASSHASVAGQVGWWLVQVVSVILGLYLALSINPELGIIFLLLPLFPVFLGLHMLSISSKHGSWAFALPGAMFTAWLLMAVFPLQ